MYNDDSGDDLSGNLSFDYPDEESAEAAANSLSNIVSLASAVAFLAGDTSAFGGTAVGGLPNQPGFFGQFTQIGVLARFLRTLDVRSSGTEMEIRFDSTISQLLGKAPRISDGGDFFVFQLSDGSEISITTRYDSTSKQPPCNLTVYNLNKATGSIAGSNFQNITGPDGHVGWSHWSEISGCFGFAARFTISEVEYDLSGILKSFGELPFVGTIVASGDWTSSDGREGTFDALTDRN